MARLGLFTFVVVALVLTAMPADARRGQVETYIQLKRSLRGNAKKRAGTLLWFAKSEKPAIGERIRAASALRREVNDDPEALVRTYLLQAHLHGVAGEVNNRERALKRARAAAGKADQEWRVKLLSEVIETEPQIELLIDRTRTREKKRTRKPLSSADMKLRESIEEGLDAYKKLKDEWQQARARLWLIRHAATAPGGREKAIMELARLVRVGGRSRDLAPMRAKVRRTRAWMMAREGDWDEAVHESLVADRANKIPPTKPAFEKADTPYIKSKETARLCFRAQQKAGLKCADIEKKKMGKLTFYDFSQEPGGRVFDDARAAVVASVYTPLIEQCVRQGARSGELRGTNVRMEWAIGHDGKVEGHDLNPRRLRGGKFDKCLKEALTWFRYPPYGGEQHHQGLTFSIGE